MMTNQIFSATKLNKSLTNPWVMLQYLRGPGTSLIDDLDNSD